LKNALLGIIGRIKGDENGYSASGKERDIGHEKEKK